MSCINCVWNCFNWFGGQGSGWGIGCVLMAGSALACLVTIEQNGNEPIEISQIQDALNQKVIQGFINDYVLENNIFIVK